jgi:cytochrome c biogenesis protein CcdA
MATGTFGLAFLASLLSVLSPCVLPLLPIVLGAAASEHRMGPAALAGGVALSFVAIGLFVATAGFAIGLDTDVFRTVAALLMIGVGLALMMPTLQTRLAAAGGPIGSWADHKINGVRPRGAWAQFGIGLLLGAAWSPCVGPTLGAASVLAAQGKSLGDVAATMVVFGVGAVVPLVSAGLLSREALMRWRHRLIAGSKSAKMGLGLLLVLLGGLIVSGFDRHVETLLVEISPPWLTDLTARF